MTTLAATLSHASHDLAPEALRLMLVLGSALALILAGPALPL